MEKLNKQNGNANYPFAIRLLGLDLSFFKGWLALIVLSNNRFALELKIKFSDCLLKMSIESILQTNYGKIG